MKKLAVMIITALGLPAEASADTPDKATESALFGIGVQLGIVEQACRQGADVDELVERLVAVKLMAEKRSVSVVGLEELIAEMEDATDSRAVFGSVQKFTKKLGERLAGTFAEPFDCTEASWEGKWQTTWGEVTLSFHKDGRFFGRYGSSQNWLWGSIDPKNPCVLNGRWRHFNSTSKGRITFVIEIPGKFVGAWSWRDSEPNVAGRGWTGTKKEAPKLLAVRMGNAEVKDRPEKGLWDTWTQKVLVKNTSGADIIVYGYSAEQPFVQTLIQKSSGEWINQGQLYCGTKAGFHRLAPGASFTTTVAISEEHARQRFAVSFSHYPEKDHDHGVVLRTGALRMDPPPAQPLVKRDWKVIPDATELTVTLRDGNGEKKVFEVSDKKTVGRFLAALRALNWNQKGTSLDIVDLRIPEIDVTLFDKKGKHPPFQFYWREKALLDQDSVQLFSMDVSKLRELVKEVAGLKKPEGVEG